MNDQDFERLWGDDDYACDPDSVSARTCTFAAPFQEWVDGLFADRLEQPTEVAINQVKIVLLDRFFQYRMVAPRKHRHAGNTKRSHRCLFNVLEDAYIRLRRMELALVPPPFQRVIEVPSRPSRGRLDGLVLGDIDDREFDHGGF